MFSLFNIFTLHFQLILLFRGVLKTIMCLNQHFRNLIVLKVLSYPVSFFPSVKVIPPSISPRNFLFPIFYRLRFSFSDNNFLPLFFYPVTIDPQVIQTLILSFLFPGLHSITALQLLCTHLLPNNDHSQKNLPITTHRIEYSTSDDKNTDLPWLL